MDPPPHCDVTVCLNHHVSSSIATTGHNQAFLPKMVCLGGYPSPYSLPHSLHYQLPRFVSSLPCWSTRTASYATTTSCPAVPLVASSLYLLPPSHFLEDPMASLGFNYQCNIHIELQSEHYPNDHAKVAYIVSLLSGIVWPLWEKLVPVTNV